MHRVAAKDVIDKFGLPYFRELSSFGALPDDMILHMLQEGELLQSYQGEHLVRLDEPADNFQIILEGRSAFYKHFEDRCVLTRYFETGEQIGFDLMLGLISHSGTDVAITDVLVLNISSQLFYQLHEVFPHAFGLLMINLSRELSREIEILEDALGSASGWEE